MLGFGIFLDLREEDPEVEKIEAGCLNRLSYKCLILHTAAFKVARKIK